jgi:hypothetical protein
MNKLTDSSRPDREPRKSYIRATVADFHGVQIKDDHKTHPVSVPSGTPVTNVGLYNSYASAQRSTTHRRRNKLK